MSDGFIELGFGQNDDSLNDRVERFKAKTGESYRISFAWWHLGEDALLKMTGSPRFIGGRRIFMENVGYFLSHGPEYEKLAGKPSKMAIATIIVLWPIMANGEIDSSKLKDDNYKIPVKPWVISTDKYEVIKRRDAQFALAKYDLMVTCTDAKFQKLDMSPCGDGNILSSIMAKPSARRDYLMDQIERVASKINGAIASDLSLEQVREKLTGVAAAPGPVGAVSGVNMDDRLNDLLA